MSIMGTRVVRAEDPRLLTVGGTYVDDLRVPELTGAASVTFVRSPLGHARITGIDASAALAVPGVAAVLTVADIDDLPPPPPPPEEGPNDAAPLPLGGVWQEPPLAGGRGGLVGGAGAPGVTARAHPGRGAARAGRRGFH